MENDYFTLKKRWLTGSYENFQKNFHHSQVRLLLTLKRKVSSLLLPFFLLATITAFSQVTPNEAQWSGNGYSIKKVVSNTSIASGVNFSYTIIFSAPAGVGNIAIQDIVPTTLDIVSVTAAGPVLGVNPVMAFNNVTKLVTYNLNSLPPTGAPSGSFTIVVRFPAGTTCNGEVARNRAGIQVNGEWMWTPYVSTTATAVNPWVVSKTIISGAVVDPAGGSCGYLMRPGDTITYRLSVTKANGYYGNATGQQNMSNAVVTDVLPAGAIFVSSSCATSSGSTVTWNVNSPTQLLDAANPWAYYWCDIKVTYPASSFPVNTQVLNQATLNGVSCNQQATATSNQTCIKVANIQPNPNAYFAKYLALTNRVPGCSGYYYIVFCNNGNVPLTAFNINDAIPSGITVNQVQIYGANATSSMNLNVNSVPYATGITTSYNSGAISGSVNNLQFQMTGTLPVGSCLYMYVYFTVNPNPTGTLVTNCATFAPLSNALTLPQTCVNFTVDAGAPNPCLLKDICSPQSSYDPGDIVRFRLRVQNIGSASLTGANIQDILHSNFTYVGNESYYQSSSFNPPCSTGSTPPSGATAWTGVTPSHSGNNLSWNLPSIPSNCQLFYTAYCGYYGTYGIPYYYIEFDAKVDSFALPGVTPNSYAISGGNLGSTVTSNTVNILVVATFGQEVTKLLSTDNGVNFAASGTGTAGSNARFRLNYKNVSNVGVSSVRLIDLLGRDDGANDWLIFNRTIPRGSQFDLSYVGNHATSLVPASPAPSPAISWATGQNICLPPMVTAGCTTAPWGGTPDRNVRMDYGSFVLAPNKNLLEDFDVGIPASATPGQKVCNDFGAVATANFLLNGSPQSVALTPIAASPVCLVIDTVKISCCDSIKVERAPGAQGEIGCCTRIISKCEIKSLTVSVSNGTLSSASWNCTPAIPPGYVGQSVYTFAPGNCSPTLQTCVTPTGPGIIMVTYDIVFANGEKCQKRIELDCPVETSDCCPVTDFKLTTKWPKWNTQTGHFTITNPDPTNPICYVEISPSPAGTFATGNLVIDGVPSSQAWNSTRIPSTGNLTPAAVNTIKFNLTATNYKGVITVCVVKCDGTRCCYDFKWNKGIIFDSEVGTDQATGLPKLFAVSVSPVVKSSIPDKVKFVSFGLIDEGEVKEGASEFYAISAANLEGDDYPLKMASTSASWMGKLNAFFELREAKGQNENLGFFNLVFARKLPKLGCTLFDEEGNIIYSGVLNVTGKDTITGINAIGQGRNPGKMFEFLELYPNPNNGNFRILYASGSAGDVEIRVVSATGQVLHTETNRNSSAGIREMTINTRALSSGFYKVILASGGEIQSKSLVIK